VIYGKSSKDIGAICEALPLTICENYQT